jgi:hypothetical protein
MQQSLMRKDNIMEVKATLNKPYTEPQRLDFIVVYNHQFGYEIRETETALEAWGLTQEEQEQQEQERIGNLQVTKRVFALGLQQLGITYAQLKTLIATNEQAQLEWDLCVELQRNNPLLDLMAAQLGVSHEMLDYIFRKANGEDVDPPEIEEETEE